MMMLEQTHRDLRGSYGGRSYGRSSYGGGSSSYRGGSSSNGGRSYSNGGGTYSSSHAYDDYNSKNSGSSNSNNGAWNGGSRYYYYPGYRGRHHNSTSTSTSTENQQKTMSLWRNGRPTGAFFFLAVVGAIVGFVLYSLFMKKNPSRSEELLQDDDAVGNGISGVGVTEDFGANDNGNETDTENKNVNGGKNPPSQANRDVKPGHEDGTSYVNMSSSCDGGEKGKGTATIY